MSKSATKWLGWGIGAALVAAIGLGTFASYFNSDRKVVIGRNDEVYYYRRATPADARALGEALRRTGFFNDRGTSVLLKIGGGPTVVSFVMNNGAWDHPNVVSNFSEIGRRVATSVGGFPIQVHLTDATRLVRKELTVGKTFSGGKDIVYYFGSATLDDAKALGQALRAAGYFTDRGVTVALLKGEGTAVSFVVQAGVWNLPAAVATLDRLVRQIAPSVGGLPVELRMLDEDMAIKKAVKVE